MRVTFFQSVTLIFLVDSLPESFWGVGVYEIRVLSDEILIIAFGTNELEPLIMSDVQPRWF